VVARAGRGRARGCHNGGDAGLPRTPVDTVTHCSASVRGKGGGGRWRRCHGEEEVAAVGANDSPPQQWWRPATGLFTMRPPYVFSFSDK
jgi:hypothetical protein